MAKTFKNTKELFKHLNKQISKPLKREVAETVTQEMHEVIKGEQVYGAYDSNARDPYIRREDDGGLSDIRNYQVEIIDDNTIAITNETMTADGRTQLDKFIIYGDMYDWRNSEIFNMQPFPRDFYQLTVDSLKRSGGHIEAFKDGMKRMGFKVV